MAGTKSQESLLFINGDLMNQQQDHSSDSSSSHFGEGNRIDEHVIPEKTVQNPVEETSNPRSTIGASGSTGADESSGVNGPSGANGSTRPRVITISDTLRQLRNSRSSINPMPSQAPPDFPAGVQPPQGRPFFLQSPPTAGPLMGGNIANNGPNQLPNWIPQNQMGPPRSPSPSPLGPQEVSFDGRVGPPAGPTGHVPTACGGVTTAPLAPTSDSPFAPTGNGSLPAPSSLSGPYQQLPNLYGNWTSQADQGTHANNNPTPGAPNLRPAIINGAYDPRYEAAGLPVDPHLRMFLAKYQAGNNN